MQRGLKFRVWNKFAAKFQNPSEFAINGNGIVLVSKTGYYQDFENSSYAGESSQYEIQWPTGLKDSLGREIYEGDIIKYTQLLFNTRAENFPTKTKEVKWRAVLGAWNVYETAAGESDIEVIGNIFENPNLLQTAR